MAREPRRLGDVGATAVLHQPGGPDIARELQAFWEAAETRHEVSTKAPLGQPV